MNTNFRKQFQSGFSLVELVLVIGLLGIFAVGGFGAYSNSQRNVRDTKRKADLESIKQALEQYKTAFGQYPSESTCDSSSGSFGGCTCVQAENSCSPLGTDWSGVSSIATGLIPRFITDLPVDPKNTNKHFYYYEPVCNESQTVCGVNVTCSTGCCAFEIGVYLESSSSYYYICNP